MRQPDPGEALRQLLAEAEAIEPSGEFHGEEDGGRADSVE